MTIEARQQYLPEAIAPAGTYRLLSGIPQGRLGRLLGNTRTKHFVSVDDTELTNQLKVFAVKSDSRGSYPQNRYTFFINSDNIATDIRGERISDSRDKGQAITPNFEDVLSVIIAAFRRQPHLKVD